MCSLPLPMTFKFVLLEGVEPSPKSMDSILSAACLPFHHRSK